MATLVQKIDNFNDLAFINGILQGTSTELTQEIIFSTPGPTPDCVSFKRYAVGADAFYLQADYTTNAHGFHGFVTTYHENGQKKREEHYTDGKANGPYIRYFDNGQKQVEYIKDGDYYADGVVIRYHGKYGNGQKAYEAHYRDHKKNGPEIFYDRKGRKITESYFKDDCLHGPQTIYHDDTATQELHYKDGKLDGEILYYSEDEKATGLYKDGKFIQQTTFYADNTIMYKIDSEGHYTSYYPDHAIKNDCFFNLKTMPGPFFEAELTLQNGLDITYYQDGSKKSEMHFVDGKPHGLRIDYDQDHNLEALSLYKNGTDITRALDKKVKIKTLMLGDNIWTLLGDKRSNAKKAEAQLKIIRKKADALINA